MGRLDLSSEDITDGPISRALIILATPLLAQNLVHVANQVVDLFWVGQLSNAAVAAIGLGSPIYWIGISLSISGPFIAINVLVSQRVGGNDDAGAYRAAFNGSVLAVLLGLIVGGIFYFGADPLIGAIISLQPGTVESTVYDLSVAYIQVLSLGLIVSGVADSIEANFLARGDSRATLYMNVTSVVVNLVLDPLLIFGVGPLPSLGIEGAALASVLGSIGSFIFALAMVFRGRAGGLYTVKHASISVADVKELVGIGYPRVGQGLSSNFGSMAMVVIVVAAAGVAGLSAYTIVNRVISISMLVVGALRNASQSIIGQNLGAGKPVRASKTASVGASIGVGVLSILGIIQWIYAPMIITVFVPEINAQSSELSVKFLRIFVLAYPFGAIITLVKAGFNAAKHTQKTLVASLCQIWVFQIPMAAVGGIVLGFGADGVFWARSLSIITTSIIFSSYYLYKERNGMFVHAASDTTAGGD